MSPFARLPLFIVTMALGCHHGEKTRMLPTDKDIYTDDEVPEFQTVSINGVTKQVPWKEVPEQQRWLEQREPRPINDPSPPRLKVRVPIVSRTTISTDERGLPCPPERAARYYGEVVAANPKYSVIGENFGGHH
jgi:hypothetical protein